MLIHTAAKDSLSKTEIASITGWLGEMLLAQQHAKLSEGGHVQNAISLKNLFIDLPVTYNPNLSDERIKIIESLENAPYVKAKELLGIGSIIAINTPDKNKEELQLSKNSGTLSAVLLIGGPGQGKSTVGQLLCQLHRANILKRSRIISKTQAEAANEYSKKTAGDISLKQNTKPVLPIQINLPEFAAWLSKTNKENNESDFSQALRYVCQTPSAVAHELQPSAILNLCRQIDVQLVFDGFDEVGSRSERLRLVTECHDFIRELADVSANIRVLVTTRPQGYTEEFEKIGFKLKKLYLLSLQVEEALVYAHRLIKAKMHSADERSRAMSQIDSAVNESATKRLFTTPLQITIITALVQQMGNVPRERWNLFAGYFDYTYKREVERRTFASNLLRDQRHNIEQMHARVGLLLQVRAELDGGSSSRMKRPELEAIINEILEEEETPDAKKKQLISDIATAAEDRLVFLTQPEPENYGFEVRSLQEFFAAWALTTGSQADIENRLTRISRASAFRNVYLFSASRIFGSIQNYRDSWINHVCKYYDDFTKDKFGATIKAGSVIALETLEEGVAENQPKYSKILMRLAAGVLALPAGKEHIRLAAACTADNGPQLEAELSRILSSDEDKHRHASWVTLLECIKLGHDWATECAERAFKKSDLAFISIAISSRLVTATDWLALKIQDNLDYFNPNIIFHFKSTASNKSWLGGIIPTVLAAKSREWWHSPIEIDINLQKIDESIFPLTENADWNIVLAWLNFEKYPNKENLSKLCEMISLLDGRYNPELIYSSSWPVTAILKCCKSASDFIEISGQLKNGKFGDFNDWMDAQENWKDYSNLNKVLQATNPNLPWDISKITTSPPLQAYTHTHNFIDSIESASKLKRQKLKSSLTTIIDESNFPEVRSDCAEILLSNFIEDPKNIKLQTSEILNWIDHADRVGYSLFTRIPILPQSVLDKFIPKIRSRTYLGGISTLARAIIHTNGDPRVVNLAIDSLRSNIELIDIEDNKDINDNNILEEAYKLIQLSQDENASDNALIWKFSLQIKSGKPDLSLINPEFVKNLGIMSITNILKISATISSTETERLALLLIKETPELINRRVFCELMQEIFTKRLSDLSQPGVWSSLHMDFHYPSIQNGDLSNVTADITPIAELYINNIRGIEELHHCFESIPSGTGQFVVLIGENGAGKTTILRSIALALRDASDLSIWPAGAFSSAWISQNKSTSPNGKIRLTFSDNSSVNTTITDSGQFKQSRINQNSRRPVYAYGCYRGSALGRGHSPVLLGEEGGPGIATLFDPEARLINAESWLIQLEARSLKEPNRAHAFLTVIKAMSQLLGLQNLKIVGGNLYANVNSNDLLPFSALSDGYLSMSGWFIDVIARWVDYLDRNNLPLEEDFLSEAQCYILIDEIDAHIHPGWQLDVIFRAKKIFPKCVFIVTTHNPLTLAGASPHEILQLKRDGRDIKLIKGAMPPILLTGGQLYKQYFGIDQVIPSSLAKLISKKLFLESKNDLSKSEVLELSKIHEELSKVEIEGWEHLQ